MLLITGCDQQLDEFTLFQLIPAKDTGVEFVNELQHTAEFNMYTYRNFYNGGGVGIADINKDGLSDIFFCGNLVDNKLYLNKGNWKFEDITEKAGVASENVWSSGVSFADVNGDGWLDIYVCKSGKPGGEKRYNELFINNGDLTFTEKAKEYGVADEGLSSHAAFFDYDKDGDLDFYLLNNSFRPVGNYDMRPGLREIRDTLGGNKLYRNDGMRFTDVSEEAGIYGSAIGFGLGVSIGDLNKDGWQDIFVSNDFFERDYLYINQKDGTFKEDLVNQIGETSMGSMGADIADINNDGFPEIFVTEMLPSSEDRYKSKMTFENWNKYQLNIRSGYHKQFTRNVLQLNNGNNSFSEISRLANVHASDWSWSALIADYDNDGAKDIYISNGIYKDLLDQDYINYYSNDPELIQAIKNREPEGILRLIDQIPSERIPNVAFKNNKDLSFENVTKAWGMELSSHSNGAAYADLDNDGDLDLVVNNCNMAPFLYQNKSEENPLEANYLQFELIGEGKNSYALGTQVTLFHEGQKFFQELAPMRGFFSSVDYKIHFGLGGITEIDKVEVLWPDGRKSILEKVSSNQLIKLQQANAVLEDTRTPSIDEVNSTLFVQTEALLGIDFQHKESSFSDFDRDQLLLEMVSAEGPKMAKGDVNGDGLSDFYIGGAKGQPGQLFVQQTDGTFTSTNKRLFEQARLSEDTDALFFDADGDEDLDLYVCSGSNEFSMISGSLFDHLYLNDGKGNFNKSPQKLPISKPESSSCVRAADFDQDGDLDLAVGSRLKPSVYGVAVNTFLLVNDGKGNFTEESKSLAPELEQLGMITDLAWMDIDQDQDEDLVLVGDWMAISIFENDKGKLKKKTNTGLDKSNGFWNTIEFGDIDLDGDLDLVLGNHGENTRLKASKEKPIEMWVNDFDGNRTAEQIISLYNGEKSYPLVLRHDLVKQLPGLKKDYLYYKDYKGKTVQDIFTDKQLRTSSKSSVYTTQSSIAINNGDGTFERKALPVQAQFAPVNALLLEDLNNDNKPDILLGGNRYRSKPEIGIYDASRGLVLLGDAKGNFRPLAQDQSGLNIPGEIKDFLSLEFKGEQYILVARNDDHLVVLKKRELKL